MRADGSGQKRLTNVARLRRRSVLHHDGSRIVWRRFDEQGLIADVWTMKPDGSDQRQITDFGSMSWAPYEHPSGRYFIFSSNKLGFENFELFMVDAEGTKEPVRVTYSDGFDGLPVPSPDGKTLAWTSSRSGGSAGQLFLAQWNHEKALEALDHAPPRKRARNHDASEPMQPRKHENRKGKLFVRAFVARCSRRSPLRGRGVRTPSDSHRVEDAATRRALASEKLDGRLTGSAGERLAADYIVSQLQRIGAKPLPGLADYRAAVRVHGRQS